MILSLIIIDNVNKVRVGNSNRDKEAGVNIQRLVSKNKLASLETTLVRNSAHSLTYSLTVVKCRATSVAKNLAFKNGDSYTTFVQNSTFPINVCV